MPPIIDLLVTLPFSCGGWRCQAVQVVVLQLVGSGIDFDLGQAFHCVTDVLELLWAELLQHAQWPANAPKGVNEGVSEVGGWMGECMRE